MSLIRLLPLLAGLVILTACSTSSQVVRLTEASPARFPLNVMLDEVPFYPQDAYQCGPAALATALQHSNVKTSVDELVTSVYIPARRGSLQLEMLAATRREGRIPYMIEPSLEALISEVSGGSPVLVFQNLGLEWLPQWHYAVVVGFDLEARTITLRSGTIKDYRINLSLFEKTWRRTGNWGFVVLAPGELPADSTPLHYLEAVLPLETAADPAIAITSYQAAIRHWPDTPLFRVALGNFYYQSGSLELARIEYESLTNQHPQFADGHNNLAQVLLELGQGPLATAHARKAVSLGGPRAATYRKTLNEILSMTESPL